MSASNHYICEFQFNLTVALYANAWFPPVCLHCILTLSPKTIVGSEHYRREQPVIFRIHRGIG
jgi:hypothetical protein